MSLSRNSLIGSQKGQPLAAAKNVFTSWPRILGSLNLADRFLRRRGNRDQQ
jgi:hypothetical protein